MNEIVAMDASFRSNEMKKAIATSSWWVCFYYSSLVEYSCFTFVLKSICKKWGTQRQVKKLINYDKSLNVVNELRALLMSGESAIVNKMNKKTPDSSGKWSVAPEFLSAFLTLWLEADIKSALGMKVVLIFAKLNEQIKDDWLSLSLSFSLCQWPG